MRNFTYIGDVVHSEGFAVVGLDVHKRSVQVAVLRPGSNEFEEFALGGDLRSTKKLIRKLQKYGRVVACYEAGPTGYGLKRQLEKNDIRCFVIAPSLIPKKAGERVKTDRRDARKLAQYLRAGILTDVRVPTPDEEAVRDLCRARHTCREDVKRAKHRLQKFLLRRSKRFPGKTLWTQKHREWLLGLRFEDVMSQFVLEDLVAELSRIEDRLQRLEDQLELVSYNEPYREPVAWLRCFRGIDTITAMTLVTELHGFERFRHPRQLMSYLGLTPSEHSTGGNGRRGGITKAGNRFVRRLLVEASQHADKRPQVSRRLRKRRVEQPEWVTAVADRAMHRLHRRFHRMTREGKPRNKAVVACARELVGFIWDVLRRQAQPHPQLEEAA
jgi:transposase